MFLQNVDFFMVEQGDDGVAVVAAEVQGLGHHGEKPAVEQLRPLREVGAQPPGIVLDIVTPSVPVAATGKELQDGIVRLNQRRLRIQLDVDGPALAALLHLLEGYAVDVALVQRLPGLEDLVVRAELHPMFHHIEAHVVATLYKRADVAGYALLLVHGRHRLAVIRLTVGGTEDAAHHLLRLSQLRLPQRAAHTALLL